MTQYGKRSRFDRFMSVFSSVLAWGTFLILFGLLAFGGGLAVYKLLGKLIALF